MSDTETVRIEPKGCVEPGDRSTGPTEWLIGIMYRSPKQAVGSYTVGGRWLKVNDAF